jgi:hypothetical protein
MVNFWTNYGSLWIPTPEEQTTRQNTPPNPFVREGHFRFMDLPAELRVRIYSFLLPHHVILTHVQNGKEFIEGETAGQFRWVVDAIDKTTRELVPFMVGRVSRPVHMIEGRFGRDKWPRTQTQLFKVNKEISNEARGKFYLLAQRLSPH